MIKAHEATIKALKRKLQAQDVVAPLEDNSDMEAIVQLRKQLKQDVSKAVALTQDGAHHKHFSPEQLKCHLAPLPAKKDRARHSWALLSKMHTQRATGGAARRTAARFATMIQNSGASHIDVKAPGGLLNGMLTRLAASADKRTGVGVDLSC